MTGGTPAMVAYAHASGTKTAQTVSPAITSVRTQARRYPCNDETAGQVRADTEEAMISSPNPVAPSVAMAAALPGVTLSSS